MDDKTLLALFDKFNSSDAVEMKISTNGLNFDLRRKEAFSALSVSSVACAPEVPSIPVLGQETPIVSAHTSSVAPHSPAGGGGALAPGFEYIKSPIVGTFYRGASPDTPPFCDVGKKISKGQKLCIIEAMKMMNALEAEYDCEIVKVLASNGDMVEFDQPIFEVRPL